MEKKPKKITNLKDVLTPDDLIKLESVQPSTEGAYPVDNEWMIMVEWLRIAGYQAYLDARDDTRDKDGKLIITMEEILTIIQANRKLEAIAQYKNAESVLVGTGSAQSKNPSSTFKSLTNNLLNIAKVHRG